MKLRIGKYYWTELDILSAVGIALFLVWTGYKILERSGITLASVSGSIWGLGTVGFFLLYQFPMFGRSIEAQGLIDQRKDNYTRKDAKIILEQRRHKALPKATLKLFFVFFFVSGGLALVGIFTNT